MFSRRTPSELGPNRLTRALETRRAKGHRVLDLTESNPTRAGFDYPSDLLTCLADPRGLVYEPSPFGLLEARRAVARDYERRGVRVKPERVALTASTSEAYALLFQLLADAGDNVLVPRPSYPLFEHLARLDLVEARHYELDLDGGWRIDFGSLERALTARTRAVLIVSPNNPTGSFVESDELERLLRLCETRGLALIADEVFADYDLGTGLAARAGRVLDSRRALVFSLGGLSKLVGLPQVKLSWVAAAGDEALVGAALERLELICDTYLSVSTPVQLAAPVLLDRGAGVRQQIRRRVTTNYRYLYGLTTPASAWRTLTCGGGWYGILQVPSFQSEEALVVDLLEREGVLVHPGYFFDFPRESFLILSLLVAEGQFADGVGRIVRHLDCKAGGHD